MGTRWASQPHTRLVKQTPILDPLEAVAGLYEADPGVDLNRLLEGTGWNVEK